MLNIFFFGYLPLKWRRIVRAFLLIIYPYFLLKLILIQKVIFGTFFNFETNFWQGFIIFFVLTFSPVALISWLVRPFVVKED